jgi:hypothetical protein
MTAAARPVLRDALRGTREEMGSAAYSTCFPFGRSVLQSRPKSRFELFTSAVRSIASSGQPLVLMFSSAEQSPVVSEHVSSNWAVVLANADTRRAKDASCLPLAPKRLLATGHQVKVACIEYEIRSIRCILRTLELPVRPTIINHLLRLAEAPPIPKTWLRWKIQNTR